MSGKITTPFYRESIDQPTMANVIKKSQRLWVYKINAFEQPYSVAWGDWEEFFNDPRRWGGRWGGSWSVSHPGSLRILQTEIRRGHLILAYQTNRRAAIGLCKVKGIVPAKNRGTKETDLLLTPVRRFPRPIKLHELKKTIPGLRQVQALKSGPMQALHPTTSDEAKLLLSVCRSIGKPTTLRFRAGEGKTGGGFGDPQHNKAVEAAAIYPDVLSQGGPEGIRLRPYDLQGNAPHLSCVHDGTTLWHGRKGFDIRRLAP